MEKKLCRNIRDSSAGPLRGREKSNCSDLLVRLCISAIWILSTLLAVPSAVFPFVRVINDELGHTFSVCYPFPAEFGDMYPKVS